MKKEVLLWNHIDADVTLSDLQETLKKAQTDINKLLFPEIVWFSCFAMLYSKLTFIRQVRLILTTKKDIAEKEKSDIGSKVLNLEEKICVWIIEKYALWLEKTPFIFSLEFIEGLKNDLENYDRYGFPKKLITPYTERIRKSIILYFSEWKKDQSLIVSSIQLFPHESGYVKKLQKHIKAKK